MKVQPNCPITFNLFKMMQKLYFNTLTFQNVNSAWLPFFRDTVWRQNCSIARNLTVKDRFCRSFVRRQNTYFERTWKTIQLWKHAFSQPSIYMLKTKQIICDIWLYYFYFASILWRMTCNKLEKNPRCGVGRRSLHSFSIFLELWLGSSDQIYLWVITKLCLWSRVITFCCDQSHINFCDRLTTVITTKLSALP